MVQRCSTSNRYMPYMGPTWAVPGPYLGTCAHCHSLNTRHSTPTGSPICVRLPTHAHAARTGSYRSTDDLPPTYRRTWRRTTNAEQLIKVLGIGLGLTVVTGGSFAAGFLFSLGKVSELSTSDESS